MKKMFRIVAAMLYLLTAYNAVAQLPSDPWKASTIKNNYGSYKKIKTKSAQQPTDAPLYANGPTDGNVLPVDPWATARDRSGTTSWRGSGRHGRLDYTGEATTYTDAQGQEMIAPEVNRENMVIGLKQLRKMGYKIPDSYDQKIRDMPQAYGRLLKENYSKVYQLSDPLGQGFTRMMDSVEDGTGLDFENLLFNSIQVLSTD